MSNPEDEFKRFQDELVEGQIFDAEKDASIVRFSAFLELRGVETRSVEAEFRLKSLASIRVMIEEATLLNPEDPGILSFKKQLQAHYFVQNYDQAWLDLIDSELPGDPLRHDDIDIIAGEYSKILDQTEEVNFIIQEGISIMLNYLTEQGLSIPDLSEEDRTTVHFLVVLQKLQRLKPQDRFERAQHYLIENGYLGDPIWNSLLERFFANRI